MKAPKLCGAKTSRGHPCKSPGTGTGGRCRMHGGASPAPGPTHHAWKTGRGSKFMAALPKHLRDSFESSVSDPEILSVRNELGLIDGRVIELIERITTGESANLRQELMDLAASIRNEARRDDPDMDEILSDVEAMLALLDARERDESNWVDIRETIESRRKLTDTERKLLEMKQAVVDSKQLHAIVTYLLQSIATHVLPLEGGRVAAEGVSQDVRKLLQMN